MKNFKFSLFCMMALLSVSIFFTSCGKQDATDLPMDDVKLTVEQSQQQIEVDPVFAEFKDINTQLINELRSAMDAKGFTAADLKNAYLNQDVETLQLLFADTNLENLMTQLQPIASQLSERYSNLLTGPTAHADMMEGFDNLANDGTIDLRGCGWQYWVCSGGAWSGLAACVIGTSGWGLVLCNIAYYAALALCVDSYC